MVRFILEAELPQGVSAEQFAEWAQEQLRGAPGQYPTSDPIFHLDRKALKVGGYVRMARAAVTLESYYGDKDRIRANLSHIVKGEL